MTLDGTLLDSVQCVKNGTDGCRAFNTSFVSNDKLFEVDGAQGARDFIRTASGGGWDEHRLQLVWDAIALHTNPLISSYKQPEVMYTSAGTFAELFGPEPAKSAFVRNNSPPLLCPNQLTRA